MDCILKKSRWHEREKQKKESSIFHRAVKRHFSSSPETENWNCLLKKMRPVRPVNLSQPRLLPHIAPTGDPLHVRNTRRCENTRDTFKLERYTERWGKRSNHENLIEDTNIFTSSIQICGDNSSQRNNLQIYRCEGKRITLFSPIFFS